MTLYYKRTFTQIIIVSVCYQSIAQTRDVRMIDTVSAYMYSRRGLSEKLESHPFFSVCLSKSLLTVNS